jgi:hypothetical protein
MPTCVCKVSTTCASFRPVSHQVSLRNRLGVPPRNSEVKSRNPLQNMTDSLIVTVRSPSKQHARRQAIRDTWGKDFQNNNSPVIFNRPSQECGINQMPLLKLDELHVPVSDRHASAGFMTLLTYEWLLENREWDYLLSIDDDCSVNVPRFLQEPWRNTDIWGNNNGWYTSGCAAVYSRRFITDLLPLWRVDDTVIGSLARQLGYQRTPSNGVIRPWLPDNFNSDPNVAVQHYIRNPSDIIKNHKEIQP